MFKRKIKSNVKMSLDEFLSYSRRLINSCVYKHQVHTSYQFLIGRIAFLKFSTEETQRAQWIVQFIFSTKLEEMSLDFNKELNYE